jgi:predicted esterase
MLMQPLLFKAEHDELLICPLEGGRVMSWKHRGVERVHPALVLEGGLLRVLFAEEQYPGISYVTPHTVVSHTATATTFDAHLQHHWNIPNLFMRHFGWPDKANLLDVDDLRLDKHIHFDAASSSLTCEIAITNLGTRTKYLSPWVHNSYTAWPREMFVVRDGQREDYNDTDIYWGSHVTRGAKTMHMVHRLPDAGESCVLGAAATPLAGMCGYLPIPGQFEQATAELRYATVDLKPGETWRANSFICFTNDWQRVIDKPPVELACTVTSGDADALKIASCVPLLDAWTTEADRAAGVLTFTHLDKPPFATASRFGASRELSGFRAEGERAAASLWLVALRDLAEVAITLNAPQGWHIKVGDGAPASRSITKLHRHQLLEIKCLAPANLAGKVSAQIEINTGDATLTFRVAPEATVEPARDFQVAPLSVDMEARWHARCAGFTGKTVDELTAWQKDLRGRLNDWLDRNTTGKPEPEYRLVERQLGETCIREKLVIRTEPDVWMPGYLVRPHGMTGRRPLLFFLHGSGPGKQQFSADEDTTWPRTQLTHELEYMPYRLATALNCQVYTPDMRGCGEQGETNPSVYSLRLQSLGLSYTAVRNIDLVRSLDVLIQRDDVDPTRIASLGSSGGGGSTLFFTAADERVAAGLISSSAPMLPPKIQDGYFRRMFAPASRLADLPACTAHLTMLIAPRPLWILDGTEDECIAPPARPQWRKDAREARAAIAEVYKIANANHHMRDTWLEAGHCAGMTITAVSAWLREALRM